ncbi:hypothetical protein HMPREF0682_2272 [Propionibacterium acidifaciens F0233]|uniref:Uncharacterized protein n=1 Tax=Propionibacterium acidifaciens F0233 TaxID=553198 RepID=U2QZX5_9ACTN|nr:hypothetical protein HMPREF0682_2272 [Propionibacterium acidifaciens F0233]
MRLARFRFACHGVLLLGPWVSRPTPCFQCGFSFGGPAAHRAVPFAPTVGAGRGADSD